MSTLLFDTKSSSIKDEHKSRISKFESIKADHFKRRSFLSHHASLLAYSALFYFG
jgi:hypothetical protein